jgi:hypothetical protein
MVSPPPVVSSGPRTDTIVMQCLFEPRVIDFDGLKQGIRPSQDPGVSEDIVDIREPRDALMEKYVRGSRSCLLLRTRD